MDKVEFQPVERAFSLKEAAPQCGASYSTLWRAACRGDLKVLAGMGRMMVSALELNRFLSQTKTPPKPRKRKALTDGLELPS